MRAIADASVLVALETGRPVRELPDELAVSVITLAELELGVLRAGSTADAARRLATLNRVRAEAQMLPIDAAVASAFASLVAEMREAGLRAPIHDTWIAATALAHSVPVCTQDADFDDMPRVQVLRV